MSIPKEIFNVNIISEQLLLSPRELQEQVPLTPAAAQLVIESRKAVCDILDRRDPRLFLVVGPCSIHDVDAARDYAQRLSELSQKVKDTFVLVMRVYFEKPRTTVGWKGFLNDPHLDDSFRIDEGLLKGRQLLLDIVDCGVPVATEALDPVMPQYLHDLVTWTAIGARTTESQKHRELASGLSTPVGFKNGTDGNIRIAMNAIQSVASSHHFLGINIDGQTTVMQTRGNRHAHIVLRGGTVPNFDAPSIALCEGELERAGLPGNVVVDCSHGNSEKNPELQPVVLANCVQQIIDGNRSIVGFMIESNLFAGRQNIPEVLSQLKYGVSITDGCIDWQTTEAIILRAQRSLQSVLPQRMK